MIKELDLLYKYLTKSPKDRQLELTQLYPSLSQKYGVEKLYYQLDKLSKDSQTGLKREYLPSWFFFDNAKYLEKQPIIHFTDYPSEIKTKGFNKGVSDYKKLGLTTWLPNEYKSSGGYNFGYLLKDIKYAYANEKTLKYGAGAVIFLTDCIYAQHKTDNEPQAIFWGKSVKDVVEMEREYDEEYKSMRWVIYDNKYENFLASYERVEDLAIWTLKNMKLRY